MKRGEGIAKPLERAGVFPPLAGHLLAVGEETGELELPVKGRDLMALGIKPGPRIGELLAEVGAWWEAGDFRADRKACLAELKARAGQRIE